MDMHCKAVGGTCPRQPQEGRAGRTALRFRGGECKNRQQHVRARLRRNRVTRLLFRYDGRLGAYGSVIGLPFALLGISLAFFIVTTNARRCVTVDVRQCHIEREFEGTR